MVGVRGQPLLLEVGHQALQRRVQVQLQLAVGGGHVTNDLARLLSTPVAHAEPELTPRRVLAFLVMVFGMFMAILDIQIVSASLAEVQAILLSLIPWSRKSNLYAEDLDSEIHGDLIPHNAVPEGTVPTGALPVVPAAATRKEL